VNFLQRLLESLFFVDGALTRRLMSWMTGQSADIVLGFDTIGPYQVRPLDDQMLEARINWFLMSTLIPA
jgi:hypothetical protein